MLNKTVVVSIALLFIAFVISAVIIKPSMYSDSGWGFITMKSMLNRSPFNYISTPSSIQLTDSTLSFNNTWSPGQYIFSYWLIKCFGVSIGSSIVIVVSVMSLIGLIGFRFLFKALNLPRNIILFSMLLIVCQRYFSLPFSIYNGGEIVIFGFFPWLVWLCIAVKRNNHLQYFLITISGLIGFFMKASFLVSILAICVYLAVNPINSVRNPSKKTILRVVWLVIAVTTTSLFCYFFFLKNGTYTAQKFTFSFQPLNCLFVLAHPLASAFSLDDVFKRVFEFPSNPYPKYTVQYASYFYYAIIGLLSIYTAHFIYALENLNAYKKLCLSFFATYTIIFLFFYNKTEITGSLEMRHFRSVGLLFTPGILLLLKRHLKSYFLFLIFSSVILVSSLYGLSSFAQRKLTSYKNAFVGRQDFTQEIIDKETLSFLYKLDEGLNNQDIIYVTSPEIGLEIINARVIISSADFATENELASKTYFGRVRHIYLCYQSRFENSKKQTAIINSFKSYHKNRLIYSNGIFKIIELL